MHNFDNISKLNSGLKKFISFVSVAGVSALIGFPVLSQSYYPPMIFFQPLAYPNYPQRTEDNDLVAVLESNPKYENLLKELETAALTEELKQGQFTLLAFSDEAFNALSDETFGKFRQSENRLKILQYHLIPGKVTEEDIKQGEVTTLSGEAIAISSDKDSLTLNDARTLFPSTVATNGIIIEIDKVLLPPDF